MILGTPSTYQGSMPEMTILQRVPCAIRKRSGARKSPQFLKGPFCVVSSTLKPSECQGLPGGFLAQDLGFQRRALAVFWDTARITRRRMPSLLPHNYNRHLSFAKSFRSSTQGQLRSEPNGAIPKRQVARLVSALNKFKCDRTPA